VIPEPASVRAPSRRTTLAVALFVVLSVAYVGSIGVRASRGASITGDEPFYLLTTQSLLQDGDLDLTQQYEARSYRSFFDHPDGLWRQSVPRADGVLLSPHNPGLSILVLPGFAVGGLLGAQVELLVLTALAFALAFVLADRLTGNTTLAWWLTLGLGLTATAFVYATEVYPEGPAALALVAGVLLVTGRRLGPARAAALIGACTAIPWLGVKYAPLAGVLAIAGLWRATPAGRAMIAGLGAASAVAFVAFHVATFGGLTPYGVNTVYAGGSTGEIVADHFGFVDRAYRVWGLFVDRRFGIGRWAPLLLLVVPGLALAFRKDWAHRLVCVLVLVQVAIATFVAITMMGWWFPGRTMVTVFPLLALPLVALLERARRAATVLAAALGAWSVANTIALALAGHTGEVVIAVDPFELGAAPFRLTAGLFPSYTAWTTGTVVLTVLWLAAAVVAVVWALRSGDRSPVVVRPVEETQPVAVPAGSDR
jgi:hypothetical protein